MQPKCIDFVSKRIGRKITPAEAREIEARMVAEMKAQRNRNAPYSQRVRRAARAASDRVLTEAGTPRRLFQHRYAAGAQAFGTDAELSDLARMVKDGASAEALGAHPVWRRIAGEYEKPKTPTMRPDQAADPAFWEGRAYSVDGETVDLAGALDYLEARAGEIGAPLRAEKKLLIVIGPQGAGKSTFIRPWAAQMGAAAPDADLAKEVIEGYEGGKGTLAVHDEGVELRNMVVRRLAERGQNLILERVGFSKDWDQVFAAFKAQGYEIRLAFVEVSGDEAARRATGRFLETGRYVDFANYARAGELPGIFQRLVENQSVSGHIWVNGNAEPKIIQAQAAEDLADAARRRADPAGAGGGGGDGRRTESQGDGLEPLGQFTFQRAGVLDAPSVISLFETADRSTFLHETGHWFLEMLRALAARDGANARVKADWAIVKKWLGADGDDLARDAHETFARGLETYVAEGRAPQPRLMSVFDAFAKWLRSIYKSFRGPEVALSEDVRDVFARMLGGDGDGLGAATGRDTGLGGRVRNDADRLSAERGQPDRRAGPDGRGSGGAGANQSEPGRSAAPAEGQSVRAQSDGGAPPPASGIDPRVLARAPELRDLADALAAEQDEVETLFQQGALSQDDAAEALNDPTPPEKRQRAYDLLRAVSLCMQYGAR